MLLSLSTRRRALSFFSSLSDAVFTAEMSHIRTAVKLGGGGGGEGREGALIKQGHLTPIFGKYLFGRRFEI